MEPMHHTRKLVEAALADLRAKAIEAKDLKALDYYETTKAEVNRELSEAEAAIKIRQNRRKPRKVTTYAGDPE